MCAHYETPEQIEKSRVWDYLPPNPIAFGEPVKKDAFPTDRGPFVKIHQDTGELSWAQGRFGLVPHWTKPDDLRKAGRGTYNARTETVHEKPSFRTAWKFRNWCIIPAAAIYEPSYETGRPVPWRIARADGQPLAIAGIRWGWKHPETGEIIESYSMLTINAEDHPLMRRFHPPEDEKRMVVMLEDDQHEAWLHASHDEARSFFTQYPAENLIATEAPRPARPRLAPAKPKAGAQDKLTAGALSGQQGSLRLDE